MNQYSNYSVSKLKLLFTARQGYMIDKKTNKEKKLISILLVYILSSMVLLFITLFFSYEIEIFFVKYHDKFSVENVKRIIMLIFFVGIFFEDYTFFKTKTHTTLFLFFNYSRRDLFMYNSLKNSIVTLPIFSIFFCLIQMNILKLTTFFLLITLTFLISYLVNLYMSDKDIGHKMFMYIKKPRKSAFYVNTTYFFSSINIKFLLNNIVVSMFSVAFFLIIKINFYDYIEFRTLSDAYFSTVFLFSIFFSGKLFSLGLVILNEDLNYFKVCSLDIKRMLWSHFIKGYIIVTVPIVLVYIGILFHELSIIQLMIMIVAIIQVSILLFLIDFYISFKLKQLKFSFYSQLLNYKIPIKDKLIKYIASFFLGVSYVVNSRNASNIFFLILISVSIFLLTIVIFFKINNQIKEY